ncbi:MAG TPA: type II secretion system F family protein [Limnobacter sp.]|uniref:type II secretion system F family protein n=1 Tax=Limnobacter sp. TaxID=2003368 RepID=UPI002E304E3C|nr:type II secretion system F family protein [Limnobacter sp.]HEX5487421.1 type II secretion system F family protein [Limnobacter sp.]
MQIKNYRLLYLAPKILDGTARPEPRLSGYFRHELVVAATRRRDAVQAVHDRGGVVLDVMKIRHRNAVQRVLKGSISRAYKQKFLQALSFNVKSGLSPEKALEQVILGELGEPRVALNHSLNALRQGFGFVQSLELLGWFDDATLAVMRAGEKAGELSKSLETAVGFYTKGTATLKLMFGAVVWTVIDLIMAVTTVISIRFGLIESLKKSPLKSDNVALVARFKFWLGLAENINDLLLVVSFVAFALMLYFTMMLLSPDPKVRGQAYALLERVPVLNRLLVSAGLSATMRVLASLLGGGVSFLAALNIARRGTLSRTVDAFWGDVAVRAEIGEHPSNAFNHVLLDGSERLLIRAHKDQHQLAECLSSISASREEVANTQAKKFAVIAFLASLLYSGIAVLFSLAVVYLQNQAVISGA